MRRRFAGHQIGHHPPSAGAYAETVTAETCRQKKTRIVRNLIHHRDNVSSDIDHAGPGFFERHIGELWQAPGQPLSHLCERLRRRIRVEDPG